LYRSLPWVVDKPIYLIIPERACNNLESVAAPGQNLLIFYPYF
jgi:hypothetical protein